MIETYVIINSLNDILDVVRAQSERDAWNIGLGWPGNLDEEISYFTSKNYYCTKATLTWTKPEE